MDAINLSANKPITEINTPLSEKHNEINRLFTLAEKRIKQIEFNEGLILPAVNELRYAGKHLINSLADSNIKSQENELRKAEKHCMRAIYDASEAGVLYSIRQYQDFRTRYKSLSLSNYYDDFDTMVETAEKAIDTIEKGPTDAHKDSHYNELYEMYSELSLVVKKFFRKQDDLNIALNQFKFSRRTATITIFILASTFMFSAFTYFSSVSDIDKIKYETCMQSHIAKPGSDYTNALKKCNTIINPDN